MKEKSNLYYIVEYILNETTSVELNAIKLAVEKREGAFQSAKSSGLPDSISSMATSQAAQIGKQVMGEVDIEGMTEGLIRQMLSNYRPVIPPEQIDVLVKHFLAKESGKYSADQMPEKDVLTFMVQTFIDYSLNTLDEKTENEMRQKIDDWPKAFWEKFPVSLKKDIKEVIDGKISPEDILKDLSKYYQS